MEFVMIDRRLIGDVAFAILLAIPTLSLTRPAATEATHQAAVPSEIMANAVIAERSPEERRHSLPG